MPLHRSIAVAAACMAAGAATAVIADDQAVASQPTVTRYLDLEANKAASMRGLGRAHHPVGSDAVAIWNGNAGAAAIAACISPAPTRSTSRGSTR